ncbi:MAG: Asp-tRNA(Asn)/Glu-tRNA(Gln) amidotransferase subunit GatC [Oscillospiraceae bacterium]|jgi:aspartyl-tRNA(Asn)/glutamyl-tRNA(Gln) amidotransferase subunit C|nr:Asp-tRNA(Asn)/Glu-tRNA(Gln) amidotransferase subunit GatC [Oscillospiraceae bacterium]
MELTDAMTHSIAKLSGIRLSDSEAAAMTRDLGGVVGYFDLLNELDTRGVSPRAHVLPLVNHWREDAVTPSAPRDELIANAPARHDGYVVAPKTFEGGGSS